MQTCIGCALGVPVDQSGDRLTAFDRVTGFDQGHHWFVGGALPMVVPDADHAALSDLAGEHDRAVTGRVNGLIGGSRKVHTSMTRQPRTGWRGEAADDFRWVQWPGVLRIRGGCLVRARCDVAVRRCGRYCRYCREQGGGRESAKAAWKRHALMVVGWLLRVQQRGRVPVESGILVEKPVWIPRCSASLRWIIRFCRFVGCRASV